MSVPRRGVLALVLAGVTVCTTVALGEALVRIAGRLAPTVLDYPDTIEGNLLRPGFAADVAGGDGGLVRWTNNSAGFRADREFSKRPPDGTVRILSLGDSFTAGYRVGDDETFSRRLELWFNENAGPTEILINAVEEPDNGLRYLREAGEDWSPHLLLFGITLGNDIAQAYISRHPTETGFLHGIEELEVPSSGLTGGVFATAGRRLYYASLRSRLLALVRPRRAILSWYGHIHPPRLFDPIQGFGFFLANPPSEVETAYERLFEILDEVRLLCDSRGIEMVVGVFPQRFQVQPEDWRAATTAYGMRDDAFDLNRPNEKIAAYCRATGVVCVDPTEFMRSAHEATGEQYYFPLGDMHWNAAGHALWAEGARGRLLPLLQRRFANQTGLRGEEPPGERLRIPQ